MWLSFVHSIKMCLIEYWFPHGHFMGGSSLIMKEWVSRVCLMRSRVRVVSSLLVLLGSSFLSFKMGCIWKSFLWGFSSHNCCHFLVTICLILGLRSVFGVLIFEQEFKHSTWSFKVQLVKEEWISDKGMVFERNNGTKVEYALHVLMLVCSVARWMKKSGRKIVTQPFILPGKVIRAEWNKPFSLVENIKSKIQRPKLIPALNNNLKY